MEGTVDLQITHALILFYLIEIQYPVFKVLGNSYVSPALSFILAVKITAPKSERTRIIRICPLVVKKNFENF